MRTAINGRMSTSGMSMVCRSIQLIAMEKHTKMMKKIISGKGRKLATANSKPVMVSTTGYCQDMGSPQYLHLPSKNR